MKKQLMTPTAVRRAIPWANARGLREARREVRRLYRIVNRSMRPFVGVRINAETAGHIQIHLDKVIAPKVPVEYVEINMVLTRD